MISISLSCVWAQSDQSLRQDDIRYYPDPYLWLLYGKETTEDMKVRLTLLVLNPVFLYSLNSSEMLINVLLLCQKGFDKENKHPLVQII